MTDELKSLTMRMQYERGPHILSLYESGEEYLAVDVLLDNLDEFEIPVSLQELEMLTALCRRIGLPLSRLEPLTRAP